MTDGVLFVCHANVCRSRLMERDFRTADLAAGGEPWHVASAGVAAVAGQPICEEVRALTPDSAEQDSDDGARLLDRDLLLDAGLVITATRAERSEIALLDPAMRSRTFTLREAVILAKVDPPLVPTNRAAGGVDLLAAFTDALDQRRGSVRVETASGWSRWVGGRNRSDDADIADAHNRRLRDHRRALQAVRESTLTLHTQLREFAERWERHVARKP
ncbi:hypothetical protein ACIGEP_11835 [Microbacterium sp. NPDC077663]|uniref:arsenate reductase/protein-tyrosine-phosphatase family protein n=1 Tax=Microbacterium sp. NPDC077663 TaxID=3364189 RepID=UPI0037C615EA